MQFHFIEVAALPVTDMFKHPIEVSAIIVGVPHDPKFEIGVIVGVPTSVNVACDVPMTANPSMSHAPTSNDPDFFPRIFPLNAKTLFN